MTNKNSALGTAKANRNDEFYTQLTDIEKELKHYRKHFNGKTVLCNCDDPFESNFFKYFVLNFNRLGLKKLIATCYVDSPIMGSQFQYCIDGSGQMSFSFGDEPKSVDQNKKPYKAVVTKVYDKTGNGGVDMIDIAELFKSGDNTLTVLDGDGDFRSEECIELLKEADIVVTNPPFSLFREYVAQLMEYDKKFIIIGNLNAITYKEFFPLLKDNKVWLGATNFTGGATYFIGSPELYDPVKMSNPKHAFIKDGMLYWRVNGVRWYTNLDIKQRHEEMILVKRYNPKDYPRYDNYDGINVTAITEIPCDFDGVMGVPITFLEKYNPDQFEILGLSIGSLFDGNPLGKRFMSLYREQGGTGHYSENMIGLGLIDVDGKAKVPYGRILIRNKHPEQKERD